MSYNVYPTVQIDEDFWARLERTAAKVATWPSWKTGTMTKDKHLTWPQRKAKENAELAAKKHEEELRRKVKPAPVLVPSPKYEYGILCGVSGCDHGSRCRIPNCKSVARYA